MVTVRKTILVPALPALFLLFAVSASASDGRVPIASVPFTISAPGSYYLTADLTATGGTAITIAASGVTLDLAGHTLSGPSSTCQLIYASGFTNLHVTGGFLQNASIGIYFGVIPGGIIQIDHIQISNMLAYGIALNGGTTLPECSVEECGILTANPAGYGIDLSYCRGGIVARNRVAVSSVATPTASGIRLSNCTGILVADNTFHQASIGIYLYVSTGITVSRNNCSGNTAQAIGVSSSNYCLVESNLLTGPGGWGIIFQGTSTGCAVRSNVAKNFTNGAYNFPGSADGGGNLKRPCGRRKECSGWGSC